MFTTALGLGLALFAGQAPEPPENPEGEIYNRMEITNGAHRAVYYFPKSPGDAEAVRDLQSAENEARIAQETQRLRELYLRDEQRFEPIRNAIQQRLYGMSENMSHRDKSQGWIFAPNGGGFLPQIQSTIPGVSGVPAPPTGPASAAPPSGMSGVPLSAATPSPTTSSALAAPFFGIGGPGTNGSQVMTASNFTVPTVGAFVSPGALPGFSGFGSGMASSGGFFSPFLGSGGLAPTGFGTFNPYFSLYGNGARSESETRGSVRHSLADGVGDEGKMKAAFAAALASQASPSYSQQARARLEAAHAALRNRQPFVAVTLRDGERHRGRLVRQNADWLVIRDATAEHYIRTTDVARMTKSLAPAAYSLGIRD